MLKNINVLQASTAKKALPADFQTPDSKSNRLKRQLYLWHRRIGLIVVVPVIFWTTSGLMHPFMANFFRPEIPRTFVGNPLEGRQPGLSLQEIARQNNIRSLRNFRYVEMNGQLYYQVKDSYNQMQYYDADTGKQLPDGDRVYAEYLARYFADDQQTATKLQYLKQFTGEYREVNRLLPVYKITLGRADALDVYVETEQSRLATFNTWERKLFVRFFNTFHNWSFLNLIVSDTVRLVIMIVLLSIIFCSALSGLLVYGLMWKRFRNMRKPTRQQGLLRKYHRQVGLSVSLVTFTFAFSGAFHAWMKFEPDDRLRFVENGIFGMTELKVETRQLPWQQTQAQNASVVAMPQGVFYQLFGKDAQGQSKTFYIHAKTGKMLGDGDFVYARYLANKFKAHKANIDAGVSFSCCLPPDDIPDGTQVAKANIIDTEFITRFAGEYGFVNKRLPVVKVSYGTPDHLTYYIETSTSRQAARVTDADRVEGYSFAFLHKYALIDWAGKGVRDAMMSLAAMGVLAVSLLGLGVYLKF